MKRKISWGVNEGDDSLKKGLILHYRSFILTEKCLMDQTKNSSVTLEEELLLNGTKGYIKKFELRLREYSNSKVSQSLFRQ